ncbi:hypothetical protein [Phyllobacterium bourgognense]|uniref:Uncharacterized protein n=1 Tax=Phyllobacterium bourgognense TaxID=314236 RepID=A0A368Z8X9_9HYPH|nr:hypothetical protein [Phyllobacterium bourgognense]RCW87607.1 hypothetical protein C7476_101373 [Phyllobacterium bourgognense]
MKSLSNPPRSSISVFLEETVNALPDNISHRDIAVMSGFQTSDMIYMFIDGRAKVPLDRVTALAQALGVDAGHLFILALEQIFEPAMFAELRELFARPQNISSNEWDWIQLIRQASTHTDPPVTMPVARQVRKAFLRE